MFYIATIDIRVSDQDKGKDFYVNVLGFEVVSDDSQTQAGFRWLQLTPPGAQTGIVLWRADDTRLRSAASGLLLYTDDIQTLCQQWAAKGLEFSQMPKQQPWGWEAIAADPDGNSIVVVQR